MPGHRPRKSSVSEVANALLSPIANLLHLDAARSPKAGSSGGALRLKEEEEDGDTKRVELRIGGMTVSLRGSGSGDAGPLLGDKHTA